MRYVNLFAYVDSAGKPFIGTNLYAYTDNNPINRIDPSGLTWLLYDRGSGTISIYPGTPTGTIQGPPQSFPASNNAQSGSRGPWAPGDYNFGYWVPHSGDGPDDKYGSNGNFVFNVQGCQGCGVHAGRANSCDKANRCGSDYATNGCIRTTDDATSVLKSVHQNAGDPISILRVQ
jgi:hypothetical protein